MTAKTCEQDATRCRIPNWAIAALCFAMGALALQVWNLSTHAAETFATKVELREAQNINRADMAEIRATLRSMDSKIDEIRRKP